MIRWCWGEIGAVRGFADAWGVAVCGGSVTGYRGTSRGLGRLCHGVPVLLFYRPF
jgi:hypothetical protein